MRVLRAQWVQRAQRGRRNDLLAPRRAAFRHLALFAHRALRARGRDAVFACHSDGEYGALCGLFPGAAVDQCGSCSGAGLDRAAADCAVDQTLSR